MARLAILSRLLSREPISQQMFYISYDLYSNIDNNLCRQALMARKVLECLCPCFFEIKDDPLQIELPLLRNVSKLEFPEREFSPDLCSSRERYVLPEFKLHEEANKRRSTASCKMEEHEQHKQIEVTPICLSGSTRNRVLQ